jgi:hypothetical protein
LWRRVKHGKRSTYAGFARLLASLSAGNGARIVPLWALVRPVGGPIIRQNRRRQKEAMG